MKNKQSVHPQNLEDTIDFKKLFLSMREAFCMHRMLYDCNGKALDYCFLEANPAFFEMLGKKREEVLGKTLFQLFPESEPYWIEKYAQVVEKKEAINFENFSASLGKWFNVHAYPWDSDCFVTLFMDITEQKILKEELNRDESRFKAITNSMEDMVFTLDTEGRFTAVYGKWLDRYGLDKYDFIGRDSSNILGADKPEEHKSALNSALRGEIAVYECGLPGLGIHSGPVMQTVFTPMLMHGKVIGIVGVGRDVSDLVRSQRQLQILLEEKMILLQEVQHRVKNNLQIIISLIQLQTMEGKSCDCDLVFDIFQSRIYAIASVHDVLSASVVSDQVSLAALMRTLSAFCLSMSNVFSCLTGVEVLVDEEIMLPVEVAVPVALIVHECLLRIVLRKNDCCECISVSIYGALDGEHICSLRIQSDGLPGDGPDNEISAILTEGLCDQIKGVLRMDGQQPVVQELEFPMNGAGHPIYPFDSL